MLTTTLGSIALVVAVLGVLSRLLLRARPSEGAVLSPATYTPPV